MKIGILTFTDGTNIGQRLQNYALQTVLESMEHDVYTIKQEWPFNKTKKFIKSTISGIKDPHRKAQEHKRSRKFNEFNREHINFYDREISFAGDNTWISKEFDAFVAGSDQIWNPMSPLVGDNFFLGFARPEQRYTYAPSFSVETIPDDKRGLYKQRLNQFATITVREERGAEIVEELIGNQAHIVLDPTLLLNRREWDHIKSECTIKPEQDYILTLLLGSNQDSMLMDVISKAEILLGNREPVIMSIDNLTEISPAEFLDAVECSRLIITDSYHVSIFATIYEVPFVNLSRAGTSVDMNSRFTTLYHNLGIESRNWNNLKGAENPFNMDFAEIEKTIEKKKVQSIKFLESIR